MFLEKLKLQLFAANNDNPDDGEQDIDNDDVIEDKDDETTDDDEEIADDNDEPEGDEGESEGEEGQEETEDSEDDKHDDEPDKPFMVFKSKEDHQKYMDNVIGKRLGDTRKEKEKLEKYESMMNVLQEHFEVSDVDGLEKKIDELLDDIAYKRGTTKEQLKKQQKAELKIKQFEAMRQEQQQQAFFNAFNADCDKLAKLDTEIYGDIDRDKLMENRQFLAMLSSGVPFKQAYDALHFDTIIAKQTQKVKKTVLDDVKAKGNRIKENATKKSKAAAVKIDISKMTDDELAELERRAENGEKIKF